MGPVLRACAAEGAEADLGRSVSGPQSGVGEQFWRAGSGRGVRSAQRLAGECAAGGAGRAAWEGGGALAASGGGGRAGGGEAGWGAGRRQPAGAARGTPGWCQGSVWWWSGGGERGGLPDEPTEGMEGEEEVGDLELLGALGQAGGRQALEAAALELAVAALGEVAAAIARVPGVRADRDIAGQAARAVWEGAADVDDDAERMARVEEGAGRDGLSRRVGRAGRWRITAAGLGADVLGPPAVVIVAVGAQAVAVRVGGLDPGAVVARRGGWLVGVRRVERAGGRGRALVSG